MRLISALAASLVLACSSALAQPVVAEAPLRAHLSFLSDDLLEGRGTGQRGGDLTVRYLETQAALIGLKPGNGSSYRQSVKMIGALTKTTSLVKFDVGGKTITPVLGREIRFGNASGADKVRFDAPVMFVGYGIDGPDENWNDYKGVDVKGKLLIMMVNDPKPTAQEPDRFGGKSLTYYGRWMYKYEEAVRKGAAGVLLIHTTEGASYPWSVVANNLERELFSPAGKGNAMQGWIHEDAARALFTAAGKNLDTLRAQAEVRGFRPVDLGVTSHVAVDSTLRTIEQFNVIGIVPGSDPALKAEAVIYSAHWDHLGKVDVPGKPAYIWNGAVDNASGTAALLAMAQVAVNKPARRTQIFFWPCAEEQLLIGSLHYASAPLWPLSRTIANLNLESMNFVGRTRDMGVAGAERSSLHASAARVAKAMGMKLAPSIPDLSGAYFRSDHFSFAKAGVPAFTVGSSVFSGDGSFDFERDSAAGSARIVGFNQHYHKDSDDYDPAWDLSGMVQQAQFALNLGYLLANAQGVPAWNKADPFSRIKR